jgi:hypothetical protein
MLDQDTSASRYLKLWTCLTVSQLFDKLFLNDFADGLPANIFGLIFTMVILKLV